MGITVNQSETLGTGIVVNDYYVSLGHHSINIEKRKDRNKRMVGNNLVTEYVTYYTTRATFYKWISKDARDTGSDSFGTVNINIKSETPPTENVYDILYTELKKNFENYNDSM